MPSSGSSSTPRRRGPRPARKAAPRALRPASRYYFDRAAADRVCVFFETCLVHSKGEWAGKPFLLEPWQRSLLRNLFGWKRRKDGLRRYRTFYLRVPRKNGKSTLAAGIVLFLLFCDGEPGAEIYGAAKDRGQASIIFTEAARMVEASPDLAERAQVFKGRMVKSIVVPETMSSYEVLSQEAGNKDGLNPHGLVIDELHEFDDRELYSKLDTATGARRQPLKIICTTAGVGRHTLYAEIDELAVKVWKGIVEDETMLVALYGAGKDDDWHSEKTWRKANPNYGVSVKPEFLREQHTKAVLMPALENQFKRYHLNLDTEQTTRWLPIDTWDRCGAEVDPALLAGRPCHVGLDLSSRKDMTSAVACFKMDPDEYWLLPHFWIPLDSIEEAEKRDKVPLQKWVEQGLITATPGNVIDYEHVRTHLQDWGRAFEVLEIAYDPWGATQLALQLQDDGATCVEFRQGYKSMSEPMKGLEALVLQRRLRHAGHPVLRWNVDNVAVEMDAAGNIKANKRKSTARIDGFVAALMGLGRATLGDVGPSIYETRGVRVV